MFNDCEVFELIGVVVDIHFEGKHITCVKNFYSDVLLPGRKRVVI